ncbi:MAG: hypothetical protein AB7F59_10105 [Bdellovibrionales bacterium]
MAFKEFLFINGAVVSLLVFFLLRNRRRTMPSLLNFSKRKELPGGSGFPTGSKGQYKPKRNVDMGMSLNCFFNYNGHTWDAYEVLGIPAKSPWELVEAGFKSSLANAQDKERVGIIEAAHAALKEQFKK